MSNSAQHLNGDQMCALDVETTGLDPRRHEIIQLAIVPLDSNFDPRTDVIPVNMYIRPDRIEEIDWEGITKSKEEIIHIIKTGFDTEKAKDLVFDWSNKLGLPYRPGGMRHRLVILAHNAIFDISFVKNWLEERFSELFHHRYVDTMVVGEYLCDKASWRAEPVPYTRLKLNNMATKHAITNLKQHDALQDALTTAKIYKAILKSGSIF